MKLNPTSLLVVALATVGLLYAPAAKAGLYDDKNPEITTGDLNSQDYWWTKYDAMMLELALKEHQPEGRIGMNLAIALRRIDELQKTYPKHLLIQQWKTHFEEVQSKIDPNAQRSLPFGPECPWDEANFAQLWVNMHWVKLLVDEKDWNHAGPLLSNIRDNENIMLRPDRMKDYPAELKQWVIESKPEADKLSALVRQKTGAR